MGKQITTEIFIERVKLNNLEMFKMNDYSETVYTNLATKVTVECLEHGPYTVWPGDHMRGMFGCKQCISNKRKQTNLKKYGVDNYFKRTDLVEQAMINKYGVSNPGQLPDHNDKVVATNLKKYGVEWAANSPEVVANRKATNKKKYGYEYPMQNKNISAKAIATKINNGSFTKSNSSKEATKFINKYIRDKSYHIDQCAFADADKELFEWGIYHNGRWVLFDLVVFEKGFRGDKDRIIEILEYHGPFHYTEEDMLTRGHKQAYPWKTNKTTITESFQNDQLKKQIAENISPEYNVIWSKDI